MYNISAQLVHEDILNFSATDNYWCAVFERAVKDYVKRSNNCKGVEGTYAKAEARREYLKSLQEEEILERPRQMTQVRYENFENTFQTERQTLKGVKLLVPKLKSIYLHFVFS